MSDENDRQLGGRPAMGLDAAGLREIVVRKLGGGKLIAVSNREPYVHSWENGKIKCVAPAGGLVTALEPVMRACGGTWVAHGSGDADRAVVDEHDRVAVPPGQGSYTLRRIWLTEEEEQEYYFGFANQALWPLCHLAHTRPRFNPEHWQTYREVNRRFARAVLDEVGDDPAWVFIQDYHFALVPRMIKRERPDLIVAHFWHIPWPNQEAFTICPWAEEILQGLLGNDLMGFHVQSHCNNFMNTVNWTLESIVDFEDFSVQRGGHCTQVRAFPISVDCEALSRDASSDEVVADVERLREELELGGQLVGIGVDRLDYTKGIPERFLAIDRFFEKYPAYVGKFTFLQVGPASRTDIEEYKDLNDELNELMTSINGKYGCKSWQPIRILKGNHPRDALLAFFRLSDICIVSSLHDGMNLVAKEFICSTVDGDGVLILSRFTGASRELTEAIQINPYDVDMFSDAIKEALEMPRDEKVRGMMKMREALEESTIYDWAADVVIEISRLS